MNTDTDNRSREARFGRWLLAFLVGSIVLGVAVSVFWFVRNDAGVLLAGWRDVRWWFGLPVILVTLLGIGLRFLRWHYLLRVSGVVVPTRDSFRVYLSGLAMALTPAYIGEVAKAFMLRRLHGTPVLRVVAVIVAERVLDFAALGIIALVSLFWGGRAATPAGAALGALLLLGAALGGSPGRAPRPRGGRMSIGRFLFTPSVPVAGLPTPWLRVALVSVGLSLVAWAGAATTLVFATRSAGAVIGLAQAARAFALSTMLGGVTLIPAGIGVTGSTMVLELTNMGVARDVAALSALLLRLGTVWFSVVLGTVVLALFARRFVLPSQYLQLAHFDQIAPAYADQIQVHMQEHFLVKKIEAMLPLLPAGAQLQGADLGCGWGWYAKELARRTHHRMTALDYSREQVRIAASSPGAGPGNPEFMFGDVCNLPLADASVDFAYSINVFHHLPGHDSQVKAFQEVARVLRPGGVFFLHEMNVINPLFRFYLNYVFPLMRGIDEGTERWLLPDRLPIPEGLELLQVKYFTFLPDFLPLPLLRALRPLESWLESGRLARFSAHYMAVFVSRRASGSGE